ncbi:unnamed protein product [Agarophyton chilense]|eukprot:gb/GEZJ01003606.1/.p1 GENE.gb/GEZJ01003606.1/~~gb/GEZJ01003606.1/.p1  ORF type:complete len:821 (+),score=111.41 gb/GEZJ01003606.1/:228-2690(+)
MSRRKVAPDQTSLFLLPFHENPQFFLTNPKHTSQKEQQRKRYYDTCDVKRKSNELLINGSIDENHLGLFRLQLGDCIFLRPQDNSSRPGIGKVTTFFDYPSSPTGYARIQWFYRSEDLSKSPKEASGEDEVFETDHFDNVEIEAIAGRCDVSSYDAWVNFSVCEHDAKATGNPRSINGIHRESSSRISRKVSDILNETVVDIEQLPEDFAQEVQKEKISKSRSKRAERHDMRQRKKTEEHKAKKSSHSMIIGESDPISSIQHEEAGHFYNKNNEIDEPNCSDVESDVQSSYMDNYEGSAVRYYCRRFYDPRMHVFLPSKYEDQFADPLEELTQKLDELGDDDFCPPHTMSIPSSDNSFTSDEEVENRRRIPKKQRLSKSGQSGVLRRKKKTTSASQFALPTDLSIISSLPCRDAQKKQVRDFLLAFINETGTDSKTAGSRCLYISGVPGTGKTATVREIIRDLSARRALGDVSHFDVLEVNAMSLPDPNLVYSELYTAMTGTRGIAPSQAAQLLEKKFANLPEERKDRQKKRGRVIVGSRKRESSIILILDEMDVLMSRKQKVLYDMLEWPTRKNARMAVIGIANTMDLPERMLPRLGSRLGLNRLSYPPYTSDQIRKILELTLDQSKMTYSPDALKFCAAKVGAVSGDVRRALELCRRASEFAEEEACAKEGAGRVGRGKRIRITIEHVNQAINAIAGGSRLKSLTQLSLFERLFLLSAVSLSRKEGSCALDATNCVEAVVTKTLMLSAQLPSHFQKSGVPSRHELQEACQRLAEQRFVLIEKSSVFLKSRVVVNVSAEDCSFGLRDCALSKAILSPNT